MAHACILMLSLLQPVLHSPAHCCCSHSGTMPRSRVAANAPYARTASSLSSQTQRGGVGTGAGVPGVPGHAGQPSAMQGVPFGSWEGPGSAAGTFMGLTWLHFRLHGAPGVEVAKDGARIAAASHIQAMWMPLQAAAGSDQRRPLGACLSAARLIRPHPACAACHCSHGSLPPNPATKVVWMARSQFQ